MASIIRTPNTEQKLEILSSDAKYDLAGSCGRGEDGKGRERDEQDRWIYPVTLPTGGKMPIFKTLLSNVCSSDCGYCPLRANRDPRRCSLSPEEEVKTFLSYYRRKKVFGLFVSSGILGTADNTMEQLNRVARILRFRENFKGYIHIKIIPGASTMAIDETVRLASAVSLNIETAGEKNFEKLSQNKNYLSDIISPLKLISGMGQDRERYGKFSFTTQFVVGAAQESDGEILKYMDGLYSRLHLNRIYFSGYQRGLGEGTLPGEISTTSNADILNREHRLYQSDYLIRQYGFGADELPLTSTGNLRLDIDPKEAWARANENLFPLNINSASRKELLRVPGFGPVAVKRVLQKRREGLIGSLAGITRKGKIEKRALEFVRFG